MHSVDGAINPFGPNGQDWEHVTTRDWIHFTDEGIAVNSHGTSNPDSWKSAWTGSIIKNNGNILGVPKGAEVAYFSGLSKKDGSQNIWAAWSNDGGKTFVNALNDGAPVLSWNHLGASQQPDQERDADVIYWNGKLLMYTAEGNKLGVYQSLDGIHWDLAAPNKVSKILPETFFRGLNWQANNVPVECPQIRLMKGSDGQAKAVLFYGGKDPNGKPSQTTGTYYVVGHLDENGMFKKLSFYKEEDSYVDDQEVYDEWKAQIDKVYKAGIKPTHLDSHHHIHTFKNNPAIVKKLAKEYGLPVRNSFEDNSILTSEGIKCNDILINPWMRIENEIEKQDDKIQYLANEICYLLKEASQTSQIIEVMWHPAYLDYKIVSESSFAYPRIIESGAIMNDRLVQYVKENFDLCTYQNI